MDGWYKMVLFAQTLILLAFKNFGAFTLFRWRWDGANVSTQIEFHTSNLSKLKGTEDIHTLSYIRNLISQILISLAQWPYKDLGFGHKRTPLFLLRYSTPIGESESGLILQGFVTPAVGFPLGYPTYTLTDRI